MYEEGGMERSDPSGLVPLATRIPHDLRRDVKVRAALEGRAVQELVAQALGEYLQNHVEPAQELR